MDTEQTDTEEVGSLDGPAPIEIVQLIEGAEVRIVARADVVIAHLDSLLFAGKTLYWGENPVPIIDSTGFRIGFGTLYTKAEDGNKQLLASIFADYASPDRLTLETKAYPLYAYLVAYVGTATIHIFAIKLDAGKPADPRIQPL